MVMLSNGAVAHLFKLVDTGISELTSRLSARENGLQPDDLNSLILDSQKAQNRISGFIQTLHVAQEFKNVDEKEIQIHDVSKQIKESLVEGGNLNDLLQKLSFLDSEQKPLVDQKVFDRGLTQILSSVLEKHYDDNSVLERVLDAFALTSKSQSLKIPENILLEILKKETLSAAQQRLIASLDLKQVYDCFNNLIKNTNSEQQNIANATAFKKIYLHIKKSHVNYEKDKFLKGFTGFYKVKPQKLRGINPYLREFVELEANC